MRIELSAGDFHYAEYGDSDDPVMVLLHGLTSDGSTWDLVVPELAKRWRVVVLDQRGHGRSPRTPEYSFELMAEDLLEFVDVLGVRTFLLCGHSMGGTVAAIFAERYAGRLSGLILVDSPPPDGQGEWTVPPKPEEELGYDWAARVAIIGQLANPDPRWWEELPSITVPTLVVAGGSTSGVPQELLAKAAEQLPNANLITIEGAGHVVQRTRPTELLAAIQSHFGD